MLFLFFSEGSETIPFPLSTESPKRIMPVVELLHFLMFPIEKIHVTLLSSFDRATSHLFGCENALLPFFIYKRITVMATES